MSLTVFLTSRIPYAPMMARASDVGTTALPSCADLVPTGVIVLERSQHGWVYVAILRFPEQTHHRLRSQKGPPASSRCHRYLRLFFFFLRAAYLKPYRSSPRVVHQTTFFLRRPPSSCGLEYWVCCSGALTTISGYQSRLLVLAE
jgi:hypothetical protein